MQEIKLPVQFRFDVRIGHAGGKVAHNQGAVVTTNYVVRNIRGIRTVEGNTYALYLAVLYLPRKFFQIVDGTVDTGKDIHGALCSTRGSFLAYLCIMTAQKLLRPTVVSMYNYMQPIVATIAAIIMGIGSFGWQKGLAIALVFLGVYIVTQSKSKADFEKAGREL